MIEQFISEGFVRVEAAFPAALAAELRALLWPETGCDPERPATWTRPVVRLGSRSEPPFRAAVNTPRLHQTFDQLVGAGRWSPCGSLGTFPVRFPSRADPGDAGWHIDMSFMLPGDDAGNFMHWRANVVSRGRALLLLCLLSDVGVDDAPTRLRVGSHLDIARRLEPAGADGLRLGELVASGGLDDSAGRPEALATGEAGTVFLCHPFIVHAAQPHRGVAPRFLAQPPLLPRGPALELERADGDHAPVELAIRRALGRG